MKVLHYVDEDNLAWGETWIQLLKELARQGVENFAVCRGGGRLARRLAEEGLAFDTARPLAQFLPFTDFALGAILRRERPDLIHTRLSSAALLGGWWGKRLNIPVIETFDKCAKLKYYRTGDFYFACSERVKEYFAALGAPAEKIAVVHNAVDAAKYTRNEKTRNERRSERGVAEDEKIILAAGRFVEWKGFDILIKGYEKFVSQGGAAERTFLWIVGGGEERERLAALAESSGARDKIKIFLFADDIRPYMWAADLFVLPSKEPEPFGLVLLEAMASGLPVIATKAGGPLDIVEEGVSGWFAEAGSAQSLADAMREALTSPDLAEIARDAVKRAGWFSVSRIAEETIGHYRRVIAEAKSRAARRA